MAVSGIAAAAAAPAGFLILTETRTAPGEPAGVQAWLVERDLATRMGPLTIPGHRLAQPPIVAHRAGFAVVRTEQRIGAGLAVASDRQTLVTAIDLRSFEPSPHAVPFAPWQWEIPLIRRLEAANADSLELVIAESHRETPQARLRHLTVRRTESGLARDTNRVWTLNGEPIAVAADAKRGRLAVVLQRFADRAYEAAWFGIDAHEAATRPLDLMVNEFAVLQPTGIRLGPRGDWWIAAAARDSDRSSGAWTTRIFHARSDREDLQPSIVTLPGAGAWVPDTDGNDSTVWAATYNDAQAFGHVFALEHDPTGLRRVFERSLTRATSQPLIAFEPGGNRIALASGARVEIHRRGAPDVSSSTFPAEVGAMAWTESGLLVGHAGRLIRLDPDTAGELGSIALGSGFVQAIVSLDTLPKTSPGAALGALPRQPLRLHLDGAVAGRHTRSFLSPQTAEWRFSDPARAARHGLTVQTRQSRTGQTMVTVELAGPRIRGNSATGYLVDLVAHPVRHATSNASSRIPVSVATVESGPPRILWQESRGDTVDARAELEDLRRLLAAPPTLASHTVRDGPLFEAPTEADVVVLDMDAAAQGALTRQVLLDFVQQGGGLLLLAPHSAEDRAESVRRWLEPIGMVVVPDEPRKGRFAPDNASPYARLIADVEIAAGSNIQIAPPVVAAVPGSAEGTAILAHRRYGFGRVAVLGSVSPLDRNGLIDSSNRMFARLLFDWLVNGSGEVLDSDFDGIPDDVEDSNGNGIRDPFETDPFNPDTDGDFIPDGVEDGNQDGDVDENETDPRTRDTDEDGVPDGADPDPLPFYGSPIIHRIEPADGPREGGLLVRITGRNFPVRSSVWFGEARTSRVIRIGSTELVAITPELGSVENTSPYDVRVGMMAADRTGVLENAFTYTERSVARLGFEAMDRVQRQYDIYGNFQGYAGRIGMTLDIPDIRVDSLSYAIRTPGDVFDRITVEPSRELESLGRDLSIAPRGGKRYEIHVSPGAPITESLPLGAIVWRTLGNKPLPLRRVEVVGRSPRLSVQWGGLATLHMDRVTVDLGQPAPIAATDTEGP